MKKIISLLGISSFALSLHAGEMGLVEPKLFYAFLGWEGGYTWLQNSGIDFTLVGLNGSITARTTNQGFSTRLAGGLIKPINDLFAVSTEIGYGYYGQNREHSLELGDTTGLPVNLSVKNTLTGFDGLVGIIYTNPLYQYQLFFKAGAIVQNMDTTSNFDFTPLDLPFAEARMSRNYTAVLPELKVGGAYSFAPNWSLTASYFHAFGAKPHALANADLNGDLSYNVDTRNPTMDTVMGGIQFVF